MFRKSLYVFGVSLIALSLVLSVFKLASEGAMAQAIRAYGQAEASTPVEIAQDESKPVETQITVESTIEATPTPVLTDDFVFVKDIDISSGMPTALAIRLADGNILKSNWAGAVGYHSDDPENVFSPDRGVIYSYVGDVTTTWAHSGVNVWGQRYFATDLDLYLRKDSDNRTLTFAEAQTKADSLIGSTAFLCQVDTGEAIPLTDFDGECNGKKIELELVAVTIVPHEDLADYDEAILDIDSWLQNTYPDAGFDQLTKENGWIIRFCVGKLADQTSDGSPWYLYNRGVIGFRIKDGSS